jgi:hypothetical protein
LAALTLLLVPALASAEPFTSVRDIQIPVSISKSRTISLQPDPKTRLELANGVRIIDDLGMATAFDLLNDNENLMPLARMDNVPPSADTVPRTNVEMLRDGVYATSFQPKTAQTLQMLFHFNSDVYPTSFVYGLESGEVSNVHIRVGMSESDLHDAYVGVPPGSRIDLPGERSRVYEVTITVRQGVLRMSEMSLLQPRSRLVFIGEPYRRYRLLYGAGGVMNPKRYNISLQNALVASMSAARAPREDELMDHDGIDAADNCPLVWNVDQRDADSDGAGDVCDNCPNAANADQIDANGNGQGDTCEDNDHDGVINASDNCPQIYNPGQQNEDKDMTGDACDNVDSRFSADKPWLLWGSMAGIIIALVAVGGVVLRRTKG